MVREFILEKAEGQNFITTFKIYENGRGSVENINEKGKVVVRSRTYLNNETTQKIYDAIFKQREYEIKPANKWTALLNKWGLLKVEIELKYKEE